MIPFVILLTVPIVITPFVKNIKINRIHLKYLPLFLFFVNLTILVMLRHKNVGNDTANYYYFVEKVSRESWSMVTKESTEVIFYLFMKVITMISSDPRFFIAVSGLLTSALLYPTYRRLCVDPPLTIVLFSSLSTFAMRATPWNAAARIVRRVRTKSRCWTLRPRSKAVRRCWKS